MCQMGYLKNKEDENPIESTGEVPAKNPPNVKSVIEDSSIIEKV